MDFRQTPLAIYLYEICDVACSHLALKFPNKALSKVKSLFKLKSLWQLKLFCCRKGGMKNRAGSCKVHLHVNRYSTHFFFKSAELIVPIPLFLFLCGGINRSRLIVCIDQYRVMKAALEFPTKVLLTAWICFIHCYYVTYIFTEVFFGLFIYLFCPWVPHGLDNHHILWRQIESCQSGVFWYRFPYTEALLDKDTHWGRYSHLSEDHSHTAGYIVK